MCGLLFSTVPGLTDTAFRFALDKMAYRGPDASGVLSVFDLQLGHRRLSILDLDSRSNQPFLSEDGRYAIVFNGEIYNYKSLAKKYRLNLRTHSDTEVLLALYLLRGASILNELNGMFTFIIVDQVTGEWFAARDRLGVKPLYQAKYRGGILLSSEPKPLLTLLDSIHYDPIGVRQYRKLRTFFNGRSLWSGITQFPAGHYLTNNMKLKSWWTLPDGEQNPPTDEELIFLIQDAVHLRELADVNVGTYLSGGLDSTIIAGLVNHPDTWTVGFPNDNEFEWGRLAAKKLNGNHHEILIDYDDFLPLAKHMIDLRHEPLSVPNEVLIHHMNREVKKFNKVILSGEGADELFFGYDRLFSWAENNTWNLSEFSALYTYGSVDDLEIVEDAIQPFLNRGKAISIVAAFFQIAHLHGLLRRLDSSTMLSGIEARTPFVDFRLIERLAGVPYSWRMKNGEVKNPLKRIFSYLVPPAILSRPKIGFPVPLDKLKFNNINTKSMMDAWFEFNLSTMAELPVKIEELI